MSSSPDWSERHRRAVREAAPEVPVLTAEEQRALWHRIEVSATTPPEVRRARWKPVVAGVVAVMAVGGVGAATASVLSVGGPGERLDPGAPDFAAVVEDVTIDVRFPSTSSRERALSWQIESVSSDQNPASVSTGALRLWTAGHALCSWSNTWAVALRNNDTATETQAAAVVLGARDWPSITDTDPNFANESEFDWLPDLEEAIRSQDPDAASAALDGHGACLPGLAPELGLGKRW